MVADRKVSEKLREKGAHLDHEGRYEDALEYFDEAIRADPGNGEVYQSKGITLSKMGRLEEALENFVKATDLDPNDPEKWLGRGCALLDLDRPELAQDSVEKALEVDPEYSYGWTNLGVVLISLDRVYEARVCLKEGLRLNPDDVVAWINLGNLYGMDGDDDNALESFERAIGIAKAKHPGFNSPWIGKGAILDSMGRCTEALSCYEEALAIDSEDALARQRRDELLKTMSGP